MFPSFLARPASIAVLSASLVTLGVAYTASADHEPGHAQTAAMKTETRTTNQFAGPKANTGTATLRTENGRRTLTWSDDFTIPQTPAPHWQVYMN